MSSTGSNVYPDIIVFPPDQVADITDEERAVLLRFKDFLVDQEVCGTFGSGCCRHNEVSDA